MIGASPVRCDRWAPPLGRPVVRLNQAATSATTTDMLLATALSIGLLDQGVNDRGWVARSFHSTSNLIDGQFVE